MISDIEVKISGAYGEKITANQLYKVLLNFDKMYFKMTDLNGNENAVVLLINTEGDTDPENYQKVLAVERYGENGVSYNQCDHSL